MGNSTPPPPRSFQVLELRISKSLAGWGLLISLSNFGTWEREASIFWGVLVSAPFSSPSCFRTTSLPSLGTSATLLEQPGGDNSWALPDPNIASTWVFCFHVGKDGIFMSSKIAGLQRSHPNSARSCGRMKVLREAGGGFESHYHIPGIVAIQASSPSVCLSDLGFSLKQGIK